jgi:hypothetical protein
MYTLMFLVIFHKNYPPSLFLTPRQKSQHAQESLSEKAYKNESERRTKKLGARDLNFSNARQRSDSPGEDISPFEICVLRGRESTYRRMRTPCCRLL